MKKSWLSPKKIICYGLPVLLLLATFTNVNAADDSTAIKKKKKAQDSKTTTTDTCNTCQKIDDAWFTGPLSASSASAIPTGHWIFQPYVFADMVNNSFDRHGNIKGSSPNGSNSIEGLMFTQYGITDNFNVELINRGFYNWGNNGGSSSGPQYGDTSLKFMYMFSKYKQGEWWPTASVVVGEKFPTGNYSNLSTSYNGVGSGNFVTNFEIDTQYYFWVNNRILRMRVNGGYNWNTTTANVENISSYGTFPGKAKVAPGDSMFADVAFEYSLTQNWVPAIDLIYTHGNSGKIYGNGVNETMSSSENFSIIPAIEYNFSSDIGIIAGVQITLAGRNTTMDIVPQISVCIYY